MRIDTEVPYFGPRIGNLVGICIAETKARDVD